MSPLINRRAKMKAGDRVEVTYLSSHDRASELKVGDKGTVYLDCTLSVCAVKFDRGEIVTEEQKKWNGNAADNGTYLMFKRQLKKLKGEEQ